MPQLGGQTSAKLRATLQFLRMAEPEIPESPWIAGQSASSYFYQTHTGKA